MSHLNTEELEKLIWDSVEDIENRREVVVPTRKVTYYWVLKDLIDQALHQQREEIKESFIREFCNDHNGQTRWLRGVAYDMDDLLKQILNSLSSPKESK